MPSAFPSPSIPSPDGGEERAADAEPPIGLSIDVVHESGEWGTLPTLTASVTAAAVAVAAELSLTASNACVALSSDADVAKLNAAYRGKPAPTNVLSFPAGAMARAATSQERFLGDIVLAHETVQREAAALGLPFEHHLQHLIVHGLLHLLGFDHETDAEAQAMEALEVRVLSRLGIANPYAAADEPAGRAHAEFAKS